MAICDYCNQEMRDQVSCTLTQYEGEPFPRLRVTDYLSPNGFCHDCYAPVGGLHHPGCDSERCPKCGGQAISCGCFSDHEDGF